MEQIKKAGILTGISMMSIPGAQRSGMPILPGLNATWAIEALRVEQDVGLIYRQMGRKRLESIAGVDPRLAEVVEDLLDGLSAGSKDRDQPGLLDCGVLPGVESSV